MSSAVKIILIAMATLVVGGIIYSGISGDKKIKNIKAHPKQSSAGVFDKSIPRVSSSGVKEVTYQSRYSYEFEAEGKKYQSLSGPYYFFIEQQDAIVHKRFPVIYDAQDPENSRILILEKDYDEFGLEQPDSLKQYEALLH